MPNLQNDDLALFLRQFGQKPHGGAFLRGFARRFLEPAARLEFARDPPPQAAPVIQGAIAKSAGTIVGRLFRGGFELHQGNEGVLDDVLGLAMAQAKRPSVQDKLRGVSFVKLLAPMNLLLLIGHVHPNRPRKTTICIGAGRKSYKITKYQWLQVAAAAGPAHAQEIGALLH